MHATAATRGSADHPVVPGERKQGSPSFTLARLRRHRKAFVDPRLPERCLAGDGRGRLITVQVEVERDHRAAEVDGAEGGGTRTRLVEPHESVARTLRDVLQHAAERRNARRGAPTLP